MMDGDVDVVGGILRESRMGIDVGEDLQSCKNCLRFFGDKEKTSGFVKTCRNADV